MPHKHKTIVVTGGIVSGIGKGITVASIGRLLIEAGFSVMPVKADPYLNRDAGTMNPFRHGEVFVTDDGAETDLDLGHYERFLDINLNKYSNFTSGSIYQAVMDQERDGDFLGRDVQIIPHVTDEIKSRLNAAADSVKPDFLICEIGGTVGDIEALPFIEASRQYKNENQASTIFVHVVKMDYLYPSDEGKTKPIQHSVITLRSFGIQPDILVVRCKRHLTKDEKAKLAMFTGIADKCIIEALDAKSLYDIPANFERNGLDKAILSTFHLKPRLNLVTAKNPVPTWETLYKNMEQRTTALKVGLVGKYLEQDDAYLSVVESIRHAGIFFHANVEIVAIAAEAPDLDTQVEAVDAVIVPGGFGIRGIEGKIRAIEIAREKKIPYLGICLGLQTAVIEIARHLGGLKKATSTEFEPKTKFPVIAILPDQLGIKKKGGTMRLGAYSAKLQTGSLIYKLYKEFRADELKKGMISERHRHRFEVNPEYHQLLEKTGLIFSGFSPDGSLAEFIELSTKVHPYFVATQAHPEFRSRPHRPHPLFAGLIRAALEAQA